MVLNAQHGHNANIFLAQYDMSNFFTDVQTEFDVATHDTTTFGNASMTYIPGLKSALVTASGIFDGTAVTGEDVALIAEFNASPNPVMSVAPIGFAIGNAVILLTGILDKYTRQVKVSDVIKFQLNAKSTGNFDSGVSLHPNAAEISSTTQTSVDNGAGTVNGGVGYLHVSAIAGTGSPTLTVIVEHSTDNSSWSTLTTFTAATGLTSQELVVAAGTTVNRYLRCRTTISGTLPSFTFVVSFARR